MKILNRNKYFSKIQPFINKNIIKVLTGQRRTGKSYFLRFIQNEIMSANPDANIIYINKELNEFDEINNDKNLIKFVSNKLKNKNNYLFIDEVQEIENFENALRDFLAREKIDIYITGSNAKLLSGELASLLSGRYIEIRLHPLSFTEFLDFHQFNKSEESLMKYFRYGGMPFLRNLTLEDEIVFPYLRGIYDTIILKDIVSRYSIRNVDFLERLSIFLAENTGNLISAKRISDYLKSQRINVPVNTIISYLNHLEKAFFINKTQRMEIKGKKVFEINEKYYFEDIGMRNCLIGFRPSDISYIIENAVYLHLKYLGYEVKVGLLDENEIDFVCSLRDKIIYVQVCYFLYDDKVVKREFGNLLKIPDNYSKYVISMDKMPFDNYKGIQHLNLLEFLSSETL